MIRVIKFRGKRIDNGEWVYGDLYHYEKFAQICVHYDDETDDLFQVVPDTVCQFTGLVDKNGKEIYEGDVVESFLDNEKSSEKWNFAVFYNENCAAFFAKGIDPKLGIKHDYGVWMTWLIDTIVIANVFDNPELLKGGYND